MHSIAGYFGKKTGNFVPDNELQLQEKSFSYQSSGARFFNYGNEQCSLISLGRISYQSQTGQSALADLAKDYLRAAKSLPEILTDCGGHFFFLLLDKPNERLFLATDKMGTVPVYYTVCSETLIFSNQLKKLLPILPTLPQIDKQSIYQYMYFHCVPAPDTILEGVKKLEAGEMLSCANETNTQTYFIPTFEHSNKSPSQLRQTLFETLEASVNRALEDTDIEKTGAFLSGGLDSSTVAGFFARYAEPGKAKTFTIGFDAEGYDESEFAKISADHFNTDHAVYYVTPEDVKCALHEIAAYYDEPFGNSSALPSFYCAKFAKEKGMDVLLAGDGGDELFAGNERYRKQMLFELYYRIPYPLRKALLEVPLGLLPQQIKIPGLNKLASYVKQAKTGLPDRLQSYNFLNRIAPDDIFTSEFINSVNLVRPSMLQNKRYLQPDNGDTINKMLFLDWKFTLADNDLVKVSTMCELAGIEVRYPMLDDQLIKLSTQIPTNLLMSGNQLRKFYKDTMEGFLADATINKSKKGFGLPFGVWISEHAYLKTFAYDNVRALKQTGFFRDQFLENVIKMHRSGHHGYYGELIWILMMLNLWLMAH